MRSLGRHLCLLFALLAAALADEHWDYHEDGPSQWGKTYPACNGEHQSPIMLNREDAEVSPDWLMRIGGINVQFLDYDTVAAGVFTNNGHTVNLALNFTDASTHPRVVISSSKSSGTYLLQGLHFHWQSEHKIDNQSYPLEMHMVHKDTSTGQTLVIGYVFVTCLRSLSRLSVRSSVGLDEVADAVQHLRDVGDVESVQFAPSSIMPASQQACGYFAYLGSLTTPPCTEGVTWLVREVPLCVDEWQLEAFYSVRDANDLPLTGNARPLQPINNRTVLYFSC